MTNTEKAVREKYSQMEKTYKSKYKDNDFDFSVFVGYQMWMDEAKFWKRTAIVALCVAVITISVAFR